MNPNFQDIHNNINLNASITNKTIPNQNIQNITIIKKEEQKQLNDINTNTNYIPNNLGNNQKIIKETKIITQTFNNPTDPQRFSFSDTSNLNLVSLEGNNNDSYKLLIKKIANQLKRKVRPPTQGFFNFALQKGDYSLIIIRKISSQMINHQIEFNNDIFRIYTQKLIKYRELVKRIAHLLKITMKNKKYFENLNNRLNTTVETIGNTNVIQTNINTNNNLNKMNNQNKNNKIKKSSVKNEQLKLVGNNKNIVNQKKIKTQTIKTNINKSNINNKSQTNQTNRYNSNINNNRINPVNPFFASKDKLSFNSSNSNIIKSNLQNQNQYFLHNKEKTKVSNNNNKSPVTQNIKLNNNKNTININLSKQQNNINNIHSNQNQVNIVKTEITANNNITNSNINKIDLVKEEIKHKIDSEINNKEKIIIHHIEEKNIITNNNIQETNNAINSISNNNNEIKTINNYNISENRIISNIPINSRFTDASNDIEMKDNINNVNNNIYILSDKNQNTNRINTSIVNTGTFQQIPKNNIETNTNLNINFEKKSINVNLINNSKDKNKSNDNESNTNMSNMSMKNNFNSDSNNNITISSLNKEEDKNNSFSIGSNKSKGKQIKIKLSPFKKDINKSFIEEEKTINSNMESQTINLNNIQKLNCNTFTENEINNNINNNDSIIYQKEISTYPDEASFLKKFDSFLTKNNISIQSYIPMALNINGQQYLKQNAFWEKYLNYILINYSVNNIKISLFSFAHLIEQYFLWCENLSSDIVEGFKKLIMEIILKIYGVDEINQFCTMNKIKNFGDLFEKYKILIKKGNGLKYDKEIEIKIKNKEQDKCNCELCKSEIACMKKLIEVNKNKIMGVNIESIFYDANKNITDIKLEDENIDEDEEIYIKKSKKTYPPTKKRNSSGKKKSYSKFSASKIKESSVENVEYIGKERSKSRKSTSSKKNRQSPSRKRSSSSKKNRKSSNKKEKKNDDEDMKIDTFLIKEYLEEKVENDSESIDKDNKKKGKNKKKEKSKSKNKEEKNESNSESDEKETKNKKNKKKQRSKGKNRKKEKKYSDSESEDEKIKVKEKKKKKQQYPKE